MPNDPERETELYVKMLPKKVRYGYVTLGREPRPAMNIRVALLGAALGLAIWAVVELGYLWRPLQ